MCLANYIHLCLFQWKPIDINFCLSIRCDSPSLGHKETDGSNSFWMWRPSDFMMSRLKAVLSHLVFKLHRPVARRSRCPCLPKKPEQNTTRRRETNSSASPRNLTSWEPFVHHLLCLPRPRLRATHRWFTPGAWCRMSGLSGFGVVDLLQAVIRGCWAHAGRPSRPVTGTRPPPPPSSPPSAPGVIN